MIEKDAYEPLLPYLSVCITFFYRQERLPYLAEVISNYIGLAKRTDVFIVTNVAEADRLRGISEALPHLPDQFSIEFVTPSDIGHPQLLPWAHREIFQKVLKSNGVTHFLYSEDDLAFTRSNVLYWLHYRDPLKMHGFIPSFFRVDLHQQRGWCSSDQPKPVRLYKQKKLILDEGTHFICMPNPYQGMYFLDRELMEEFAASKAMHPDFDVRRWGIAEKAAQGLTFVNIPKGYTSRNLVPIDPRTKTVFQECWIHHLPNTYANNPTSLFGKLPVQGQGLFITRVGYLRGKILRGLARSLDYFRTAWAGRYDQLSL